MAREERLKSLRKLIEGAQCALHELDKTTRAQREEAFERLESTLAYISVVVERTDPILVSSAAHAELTRLLEDISSNAATAASDPDSYTNPLMAQAVLLPPAQDRELEQAGKDAAATLRRSASQHLRALSAEAGELRARLDKIAQDAEAAQQTAETANQQAITELQTELTSIQTAAGTAQKQVEDLAADIAENFEKEQAARESDAQSRWAETRQEIQDRADDLVADLQRMREEAQGLVGAVSVASTANHFLGDARREQRAYWFLLAVTVGALGLAVFLAGRAASHPNLEVERLVAKLGVSTGLVALGVFTGRRATDHREREKRSRDKEAEMRVFGPFIEPLPPKEQIQERILMARRFFGRIDLDTPGPSEEEVALLSSDEEIDIHARDLRRHQRDGARRTQSQQ